MFLKKVSKSIAIALITVFVSMPIFNTASAMEITEMEELTIESSKEIQNIKLDRVDEEELLKIIEEVESNKPRRSKRSAGAYNIGSPITTIKLIGLGLVTIYTGGVIIKGAVIKAGTSAFERVRSVVEPYMIGSEIPSRLKKDGNTVDLGKFTDRVKKKNAYKNPKTGWTIEKDRDGHKGSQWKLKDEKGRRRASLRGNGDIAGK
ncbi:MAG: hypothetical protein E6920_20710 [Clostridium sp.]|uniref:hypothetical protein n=1 Tax=Paraclostridium sordellii TaxID=1505 RepID=UPI0005E130F3|nr:hypothetical protein [Paeniclostridium sordellii]MDU1404312.1 hypothetical protein [Clostridium sp.]CEP43732.1 Uncharacterised protein [[Clostridium] sordellii] [Paeniclostridium sordellii]CEP50468.1 Uncharacterised protein [[Clostridium] sordellii] [Paeniclostridium sordellii]CEP50472.1 Uncharacterised protein [[Clostridium] sordellii] [Paeniclostridium sordellii]